MLTEMLGKGGQVCQHAKEGQIRCPLIVRPTSEDVITGEMFQVLRALQPRWWLPQLAAKLENEAMLRRRGLIDPVVEQIADRKRQPIETHLTAFERRLGHTTSKHQKLVMSRVRRIIEGSGFETVGDIEAEAVREFLVEFCQENDCGNKTYNHYLQAFGSFCKWLVVTKRLLTDPISMLQPLNTEVDVRHKRRALTDLEVQRLVESARKSGEDIQCFDGEQRARIYLTSYFTGLRRKEIASLTPQSFDLDPTKPTVTIEAACSKHRKRDVLQLHPELVALLPGWLEGIPADRELFPKLAKRRTWLMVKKDLERAGIPYETSEGIADFHAAGRHSHITGLNRAGLSPAVIQKLARHSDIRMTMRYIHVDAKEQAQAIGSLPWQRSGSVSDVPTGHPGSPEDTRSKPKRRSKKRQNPGGDQGYDASSRDPSPTVASDEIWRRRELNPPTDSPKSQSSQTLGQQSPRVSVPGQCLDGTACPSSSLNDPELATLARNWIRLPEPIRKAIATLASTGVGDMVLTRPDSPEQLSGGRHAS